MTKLKKLCLGITLLSALLTLAACGGGGGGGAAEPGAALSVTITVGDATLLSNNGEIIYQAGTEFATNITVQVRNANGQVVPNGTSVGLSVSNSSLGLLSTTGDLTIQTDSLNLGTTAGNAQALKVATGARSGPPTSAVRGAAAPANSPIPRLSHCFS